MSYTDGGDTPATPTGEPRKRRSNSEATKLGDGKYAKPWLDRIDARLEDEKSWREKGRKVVERYRENRKKSGLAARVAILWANTEVLKSALYSRTAIPDVRRRFPDAKGGDPIARTAAEVIERALNYVNDAYDIDAPIEDAVSDYLLPGRGTIWVDYEPEIIGEGEEASVGKQKLYTCFVYWKDFIHGKARTWQTVPWVARRQAVPLGVFRKMFPNASKEEEPDLSTTLLDNDERRRSAGGASMSDEDGLVELWCIFDKGTMDRIYVARGFKLEVDRQHDPLKLSGFFPCPPPLLSVRTTDSLTPEPEFTLYQDQADELDRVQSRIRVLTEELRWKGIYDGSIDGDNVLQTLSKAADGVFLAYPNWNVLKEKGGIENAVGFWPIEIIAEVLTQLYPRAAQLIQEIYEITGISDVIRGATDPNETLGAQKLKSQFGSMRMQTRQRLVQRFIRDDYRIKAEIIAEHFTQETLKEITNIQLPTEEERLQAQAQYDQLTAAMAEQGAATPEEPVPPGTGHNGGPPMEDAPMGFPAPQGPMLPPETPAGSYGMNGSAMPAPQMAQAAGMNGGAVPPAPSPQPVAPSIPGMAPPPMPEEALPEEAEPAAEATQDQTEDEEKLEELRKIISSPTWDEVMEVLRSDKLRGTRVDVETDSTVLIDAEAEKQARIEFMSAAQGMLSAAMEMITVAPATIPLVREMFLFGIRSFKPGRALEQAFEDAFDELAKNPPEPPPTPVDPNAFKQQEIEAKVQEIDRKYSIEEGKALAEAKNKDDALNLDAAAKKDQHDIELAKVELEREKLQLERDKIALENRRMDVEAELRHREIDEKGAIEERRLDQEGEFRDRELTQTGDLESRKLDQTGAIETRKLDDAKEAGGLDRGLAAAAQNKQLVDERRAAEGVVAEEGAEPEVNPDLTAMGGLQDGLAAMQKGLADMAAALAQGQQIQAQALAQGFAQQGEALAEMAEKIAAPKRVVRGEDNRIIGVETVQ